jgi:hypothetical protein
MQKKADVRVFLNIGVQEIPTRNISMFKRFWNLTLIQMFALPRTFWDFRKKIKRKKLRVKMYRSIPHLMDRPRLSGNPDVLRADPSRARRMMPTEDEEFPLYQDDEMVDSFDVHERCV